MKIPRLPLDEGKSSKLAKRRFDADFTQEELGYLINMKRQQLSRVERLQDEPSASTIVTLAVALGCSADDILNDLNFTRDKVILKGLTLVCLR